MNATKIIAHAFRMLLHDPATTLRLTFFPFLLISVPGFLIGRSLESVPSGAGTTGDISALLPGPEAALSPQVLLGLLAVALISWVGISWLAVVWHRYALLNEDETRPLPPFKTHLVIAYMGASVRLFLLLFLIIIVAAIPVGLATTMVTSLEALSLLVLILTLVLSVFAMRLGLTLPAAAVAERLSLGESWRATRGVSWAILAAVIVSALIGLPLQFLTGPVVVLQIVAFVLQWLTVVFGFSVLTTLYGVCVQGRELT